MNNIYKVIWSKAKNCYVVASEIARSHTKSASGSEKNRGVARHALLALGAACAIACGGFVNVGADERVEVTTTGGSNAIVYTKDGTESYVETKLDQKLQHELSFYAKFSDTYNKDQVDAKLEALTTTGDVATNKNNINDLKIKAESTGATLTDLSGDMSAAKSDITTLKADVSAAKSDITTLKADVSAAKSDITTLKADVSTAKSDINTLKAKDTELSGKIDTETANRITSDTALDHKIDAEIANRITSDTALDHKIDAEIANRITSDTALDQKIDKEIQDRENAIKATNDRTGGIARNLEGTQTTIEGIVKVDNQGNVKDVKDLSAETITTKEDAVIGGDLKVTGETTLNDKLTAKGEATFEKNVIAEKDLTVNGKLNVGEIYLENNKLEAATGKKHDSATAITADGISNLAKVTEHGNTTESQFTHNEKGTINYAKVENSTGDWKGSTSKVTADGVKTEANDSKGNRTNTSQTADGIKGYATDKDGNKTYTKVTATENSFQVQDKDGKNTNHQVNTKDSSVTEITNGDGKTTKTEQTATDITNTAKDGTITNDGKNIVNVASENISNKSQTMDTTVTGKATESYGELDTTVNGKETHKVTGDQENTIGGNQTTTVEGNVKEDYKKDLTTTVGGNELHEVTGTKTENVTGKVTENYGNGQETNVTGDQDIKVSGTQTTTATDINRNASSSMVDKVDNAYGTNTETKVAGKTTTDVSIKGTGEKGQYIRGANESRDYLIKGTLMNSETKTAEATSTEITDGTNKASTRQDAKNLAGSVTNGTETGISGIHANDDGSVSIDSAVAGGGMSSVINQKKDSIQSAVGDGTNSTVIHQDKDNVTIASSNGTVAIVGKDIVNNASESITNKAKTMDTTVTGKATESYGELDTTVTGQATENFNGGLNTKVTGAENHTVTGKQTNTVGGGQIINITGGQINNITGDQTTTVTGMVTENYKAGQATNVTGNQDIHVTGKQTNKIDGNQENTIGGDQTTNVTGDILNTAKNITNAATETLTDKVGTNTRVINSRSITDTVGRANRMIEDGKITDNAGNFTVTTDKENGTTFTNAGSTASSFTTVNGTNTGSAQGWTNVKGNEISTGKVEANYVKMDYADVMHDLGVHGSATVDNDLTVKGITTTKTLKVTENATVGGTLNVTKKATFHDDVDIAKNLSVGGNATIAGDVTAKSYKVGRNTYIDENGINANNQKITNVADGSISEGSKDAVNGGQLYGVKRDLEHQVDKVGANAAAMANLRPMEFDPSSKWNIAAAIGNYGSETAAAIGAFYRPNDNVMVNLSTAFGTGENMVGGGVSVRLGKGGNKLSREETNALKAQVADLTARMDALLSVLNPNMSKDFPDVPENHWAYEAVSRLAGNDIVQGYPDGEFHGERTMTRYEMAEIIYNALSRGAEAERELVEEFKPELQAMAASEKATAEKAEG